MEYTPKTDHMLVCKTGLNKFNMTEILQSMSFNHNGNAFRNQ